MRKTSYTARLADAIREALPTDTEFVIECKGSAASYIFVRHPNGANTFITPWGNERTEVTPEVLQKALRSIARRLRPEDYLTPLWQTLNREAHDQWVAQSGVEL